LIEDDTSAGFRWAFLFCSGFCQARLADVSSAEPFTAREYCSTMSSLFTSRRSALGAMCALILTCALVSVASAQQQGSESTTDKKPSTKSSSTTHPTTGKSSTSSHTSSHTTTGKKSSRKKKSTRTKGQQKIDPERARSIQEALIREHYLTGEPSGTWNQESEDAMRKYQADHGWQSKTVPDSRALISLGLGPNHDHLLNPESAMTTTPAAHAASAPTSQTSAPTSSAPTPATTTSDPPNRP
jgi:hypothetical protein